MLRADNPLVVFAVFALFAAALVVQPLLKTNRLRVTPSKIAATLVALGVCIYGGALALALAFFWPLSLIWFPEYWGGYTGFFRGLYIHQKSPPMLVSLLGWFFLIVFPPLLWWIASR